MSSVVSSLLFSIPGLVKIRCLYCVPIKRQLLKWSCTTLCRKSQFVLSSISSPSLSATKNEVAYDLPFITTSRSIVPCILSVTPSEARFASIGPGRISCSCWALRKVVVIALSDDPECISASISFPSLFSSWCNVVCCPEPVFRRFCASFLRQLQIVGPGLDSLCKDCVLVNNGRLEAELPLYFAMYCIWLTSVCFLLLLLRVVPRLHRLQLALLYPWAPWMSLGLPLWLRVLLKVSRFRGLY